jgi:PAS domain S-box-containing protein
VTEELPGLSDATVRAICDAAVEGIILHRHGMILSVNDAGAAMFGWRPEDLVGRSVLELAAPESHQAVRDAIASGRTEPYEAYGLRKDGSRFRAEIRSRNVVVGDDTVRATVLRDFSERDEAERARAESISLLRATIESTADGILVVDQAGHIVLYNERFREIWSVPEQVLAAGDDAAAIAHVVDQLVDPDAFRSRVEALYHSGEESIDTLEFRDGRTVQRYSRPQRIGERIVGRVWSFRDVTGQRQAERGMQRAVELRDEFLSVASHELFTPLTSLSVAVRGLRGLLGSAAQGDDKPERLLGTAQRQIARLTRLVEELLDVTRVESGRFALDVTNVDLVEVVRETIEGFAPELERDGIVSTLDAPAPVRGVWDRVRIEQVAINLMGNAIKFGLGRPIHVRVFAGEGRAVLSVSDQGIGIALDRQAAIFERFQRAVSSRHFGGLGLGLFITRQIVEAHGGRILLDSAPGLGATFSVELPMSEG